MKFKLIVTALLLPFFVNALTVSSSFACTEDGKEGIAPENSMLIPPAGPGKREANGVTEQGFNAVIAKVASFYGPIIAAKGGKLRVVAKWKDPTVNAYADRTGGTWNVHMFGGFARAPFMTADGFAFTMCHELGHHLGGQPRVQDQTGDDWASNEGEADYFGALKCLRRVFDKDDNEAIVSKLNVPQIVHDRCMANHPTKGDALVCARISMAGLTLASTLASLGKTPQPAFNTPDPRQVPKTFDPHSNAQCRLDTYFSAAACKVPFTVELDTSVTGDPTVGACSQERHDTDGFRPRCWYKPLNSPAEAKMRHMRIGGPSARRY